MNYHQTTELRFDTIILWLELASVEQIQRFSRDVIQASLDLPISATAGNEGSQVRSERV